MVNGRELENLRFLCAGRRRPNEDFIPALSALEKARFLSVSDGGLSYHRPENTVADHTQQTVEELTRQLESQLPQTQQTLAQLPRLLQAWHEGATDAHHLHVAVNRGESAPADIWRLQSNRILPKTADICMPLALPMFSDNPARTGRRRVAAAMEHLNASSHFTLGAAWHAARTG